VLSSPLRPEVVAPLALTALVEPSTRIVGDGSVAVSGIGLDSRTAQPGSLYVALPGTHTHGADFAADAVARGAVAVLTDAAGEHRALQSGVPVAVSQAPRMAMAAAADVLYRHPSSRLRVLGITGTNGKTTTAFLVEAALLAAGHHVGTIGTIGFRLDAGPLPSGRTTVTTPESPDLQALLAAMADAGADSVAMEVSSHALALDRVHHIGFDVAAFTNLGRDHLDFHPSMEDYFEAKSRLFLESRCRVAVINIDDEWGRLLAEKVAATSVRVVTTGRHPDADYRVVEVHATPAGSQVQALTPEGSLTFVLDMPGAHNAIDAIIALAMVEAAGVDRSAAVHGLRHAHVPGRLQPVPLGAGAPTVRVDFAHTPQAIEQAVAAVSERRGRLAVVVGAGGDRDSAKRGPMGEAAAAADLLVVTDDNPRYEDRAQIRAAVLAGAVSAAAGQVREVADRRAAIASALAWAGELDTVLVLGKGHERGQEVAGVVIEFDDVSVVQQEWSRLHPSTVAIEGGQA
jgi:UDP-N-acetylmuramoyl-L-alanyl-D-glutamate--2,6-diaminopimelate ligase